MAMNDREHSQKVIRSLLLTKKTGCTMKELAQDYYEMEGSQIPWRSFGYVTLLSYLRSMPSVVQINQTGQTTILRGIATEKSQHISNLVAGQKAELKKRGRLGIKVFRPSHMFPNTAPPRVHISANVLTKLVQFVNQHPEGISKDFLLLWVQNQMPSIEVTMGDLEEQLSSILHKVYLTNTKIYPIRDQSTNIVESGAPSKIHSTNMTVPEPKDNCKNESEKFIAGGNEEINYDDYDDFEEEDNFSFVPADFPQKNTASDKISIHTVDETLINDRMRFRLEKLIQNNPDGIWCWELPEKYLEAYKVHLNYLELGFNSVRDFIWKLPDIFRLVQLQDSGDFKLYYAKGDVPATVQKEQPRVSNLADVYDIYNILDTPEALPAIVSSDIIKGMIPEDVMGIGECVGQIRVESFLKSEQPYIEVVVAEVFTPTFFWVHLRKAVKKLDQFMDELHNFYTANSKQYRVPAVALAVGLNCACKYNGKWNRGIIKAVKPDLQVTVMFYDYGTLKTYSADKIHYLQRSFSNLPAQALPCGLVNTRPKSGMKWSRGATYEFASRTAGIPLIATIASCDETDNSMMVTLTDTLEEEDVHINDWMVEQDLAIHGKMDNTVDMCNLLIYVEENLLNSPEKCYDETVPESPKCKISKEPAPNLPLVSCRATLQDSPPLRPPPGFSSSEANSQNLKDVLKGGSQDEIYQQPATQVPNISPTNPFLGNEFAQSQYAGRLTPQQFMQLWNESLQLQTQITAAFNVLLTRLIPGPPGFSVNNNVSYMNVGEQTSIKNTASPGWLPQNRTTNSFSDMNSFYRSTDPNFTVLSSPCNNVTAENRASSGQTDPFGLASFSNAFAGANVNNVVPTTVCPQQHSPFGTDLNLSGKSFEGVPTYTPEVRTPMSYNALYPETDQKTKFDSRNDTSESRSDFTTQLIDRECSTPPCKETNPFKLSLAGKLRIPQANEDIRSYSNPLLNHSSKSTQLNESFDYCTTNAESFRLNNRRELESETTDDTRRKVNPFPRSDIDENEDVPYGNFEDNYPYTSTCARNDISNFFAKINLDSVPYGGQNKQESSNGAGKPQDFNYVISGEDENLFNQQDLTYNTQSPNSRSKFDLDMFDDLAEEDFLLEVDFSQDRSGKHFERAPTRQDKSQKQEIFRTEPCTSLGDNYSSKKFNENSWSPITGFTSPLLMDNLNHDEGYSTRMSTFDTTENSPTLTNDEFSQQSLTTDTKEESSTMSAEAWIKSVEESFAAKSQDKKEALHETFNEDDSQFGSDPEKDGADDSRNSIDDMLTSTERSNEKCFSPSPRASSRLSYKLLFQPVELHDKNVVYIFHYRNEGWILTEQFVNIFTEFKTCSSMIILFEILNVPISFEQLDRSEFLIEFLQLESVLRKYSQDGKEVSKIHLMPLNSVLNVLRRTGVVKRDDIDNALLNPDSVRGTIMHGVLTLINAYGQFKQRIDASE